MKFIDLEPSIVAIQIDGQVTETDVKECQSRIHQKEQQHDHVALYVEISEFTGYEVRAFFRELKSSFEDHSKFEYLAVVCPQPWLERYAGVLRDLAAADHQTFEEGQEEEAREWITSRPESR